MSLKTHKRTLTDTDIINFGNLTWDHFYAHTDITSLEGSIFEKRTGADEYTDEQSDGPTS